MLKLTLTLCVTGGLYAEVGLRCAVVAILVD